MFGSAKREALEAQVSQLQSKLDATAQENERLTQELADARGKIADLEARLNDFDLERLKEEARSSRAEFEGLRELYVRKNQEFDENVVEEEERFAREAALKRHNLENEIEDNRQANQDYVTNTVKTFGESYNYYLNQIKLLMDALGDVASKTGEALFSGENGDLKARIGQQMRERLKTGTDTLRSDDGDLILIGAEEAPEEAPAYEEAYEAAEEVTEVAEDTEDAVEEAPEVPVEEAPEEIAEDAEAPVEED